MGAATAEAALPSRRPDILLRDPYMGVYTGVPRGVWGSSRAQRAMTHTRLHNP